MATQTELWLAGATVGSVLMAGIAWKSWINYLATPIMILFFYAAYSTLSEPFIGPAVVREQGISYILALYGSGAIVLIALLAGNYIRKVRKKS